MGVIDFEALTFEQAERAAAAYIAAIPARIDALARQLAASGADPTMLDGTPDSLEPLWRWIVAWYDAGGADEPAELPDWYEPDPPELAGQRLTPAAVALADRLAAYLAQVLRNEVPDLAWVVVPSRGRGRIEDASMHQPVLRGSIVDTDTRRAAQSFLLRLTLWGEGRHATALREPFDLWVHHPGIP